VVVLSSHHSLLRCPNNTAPAPPSSAATTTAHITAETARGPRFCQQASAHCNTAGTLPSHDRSSRPRRSYLTVIPSPSVQIKCSQTRARYATSPLPARRSHHVAPQPSCVPAAIPLRVVLTSRSDTEGAVLRLPGSAVERRAPVHVRGASQSTAGLIGSAPRRPAPVLSHSSGRAHITFQGSGRALPIAPPVRCAPFARPWGAALTVGTHTLARAIRCSFCWGNRPPQTAQLRPIVHPRLIPRAPRRTASVAPDAAAPRGSTPLRSGRPRAMLNLSVRSAMRSAWEVARVPAPPFRRLPGVPGHDESTPRASGCSATARTKACCRSVLTKEVLSGSGTTRTRVHHEKSCGQGIRARVGLP